MIENEEYSECDPEDTALIRFARKLTRTPGSMQESDINALREAGFDDEAVVHITEIVGYFNFVNRMALALGVELEE